MVPLTGRCSARAWEMMSCTRLACMRCVVLVHACTMRPHGGCSPSACPTPALAMDSCAVLDTRLSRCSGYKRESILSAVISRCWADIMGRLECPQRHVRLGQLLQQAHARTWKPR